MKNWFGSPMTWVCIIICLIISIGCIPFIKDGDVVMIVTSIVFAILAIVAFITRKSW